MARKSTQTGLSGTERILGGVLLICYLAVLPLAAAPALDLLERLMGQTLGDSTRSILYYGVLFFLTLAVFWGYLGRTTGQFFSGVWSTLGAVGAGLVAFYGLNELVSRLLGLVMTGQVNLNDAAISARIGAAPYSTALVVVFLAPFVEEVLFRGYLFGSIREYSRLAAYGASCLLFALIHVWQYAAAGSGWSYLLLGVQYLIPGAVMAWCYERSGTLWGSILLHAAVNALAVWSVL